MAFSNDSPISAPSEDLFGLDPFARAIAKSISEMGAPTGAVLAVNGEWGSGKSSAINLIQHHLSREVDKGEIVIVKYNPWWFSDRDTLILAFFRELNGAIGPSLPQKLRKSISKMGERISSLGAVIGAVAEYKLPGVGKMISAGASLIGRMTSSDASAEEEHNQISQALSGQSKRFVVIIDDIDRLSPDDVLTVFRLVKSVGRLPNVIYLLAFDRNIAERIVSEKFPSEGASYLDKIIQGAFELPLPESDILREFCIMTVIKLLGEPDKSKLTRFMNVFHDVVGPTIRTPRDVARIGNQLSATWPTVSGNVDRADFMAITAIQLSDPDLFAAIRQNSEELCGVFVSNGRDKNNLSAEYDSMLGLTNREEREKRRLRIALRRLFPRLDAVWGNTHHQGQYWRRDRLIAASEHFRSYFAFSISESVLPLEVIEELVSRADDADFVQGAFRLALTKTRRSGETQASLLLDELCIYADDVDEEKIEPMVCALFEIADELDTQSDEKKGFVGLANNRYRLHWVLNRLVHDRLQLSRREEIYRKAMEVASIDWATDFSDRCGAHYSPAEDGRDRGEEIVGEQVAMEFKSVALEKIRSAAADGTLYRHRRLIPLLYSWMNLLPKSGADEVRAWVATSLVNPDFVIKLARCLPSSSWSMGIGMDEMGDRVQRETVAIDFASHDKIIDEKKFYDRIYEELRWNNISEDDANYLKMFLEIPRERRRNS